MLMLISSVLLFVVDQAKSTPVELYYFRRNLIVNVQIYCTKNSSSDYKFLYIPPPSQDKAWTITGYWDSNYFVVDKIPYDAALAECQTQKSQDNTTYLYVQPKTNTWGYKFAITGTGQIMPGYDSRRLFAKTINIYCTRNDPKDFGYLKSPLVEAAGALLTIIGNWDGDNFVVNQWDYDYALRECQSRTAKDGTKYLYIQPDGITKSKGAGWLTFRIKGYTQIMPGFNGIAPFGTVRIYCTKNNPNDYGYLYVPPELKAFWYIQGDWDGDYFVVNRTAYDKTFKACKCWNYTYIQPADTVGWYKFVIKEGQSPTGPIMPGFNPSTSITVICTRNRSDVESLYIPPASKGYFWYIEGKWDGNYFDVDQTDYDLALQECQKRKAQSGLYYLYVQPYYHKWWYKFRIKGSNRIMPGYIPPVKIPMKA